MMETAVLLVEASFLLFIARIDAASGECRSVGVKAQDVDIALDADVDNGPVSGRRKRSISKGRNEKSGRLELKVKVVTGNLANLPPTPHCARRFRLLTTLPMEPLPYQSSPSRFAGKAPPTHSSIVVASVTEMARWEQRTQ